MSIVTTSLADPYPPQTQWLEAQRTALEKHFLTFEIENFENWEIGKLGNQKRIWTYFCGLGPYHGGIVVFSLNGKLIQLIDDIGCVRQANSYDLNGDGLNELVALDYGTGTGYWQQEMSIYFVDATGFRGKNSFAWKSEYETSDTQYGAVDDSLVLITQKGDIRFHDSNRDAFKDQLSFTTTTEYNFSTGEHPAALPPSHTKEIWHWDKLAGKYLALQE